MAYQKTTTALLVAIAASAVVGYQWVAGNRLRAALDETQQQLDSVTTAVMEVRSQRSETESQAAAIKGALLDELEKREAAAEAEVLASSEPGDSEPSKSANPLQGLKAMMENPVMREVITQQVKGQMKMMYGSLFEKHGIDDATRDAIYALLVDTQLTIAGEAGSLLSAGSKDAREEAEERIKGLQADANGQIKELLGDDLFDEFEHYQKTMMERMEVSTLRTKLDSTGHPLTAQQEEDLVEIMLDERENAGFDKGIDDPSTGAGGMDDEAIDKLIGHFTQIHDRVRDRAGGVLDPDQLSAFAENQEAFRNMMTMGMKMNSQFMGGGESDQ